MLEHWMQEVHLAIFFPHTHALTHSHTLTHTDAVLATKTFLVGERVTLADITVVCNLLLLYKQVGRSVCVYICLGVYVCVCLGVYVCVCIGVHQLSSDCS